jgi:predicted ester cyclase
MSEEENKAAVRDIFATMDREQDMRGPLAKHGAPGYKAHFPGADMDAAGTGGFAATFFSACPGLKHNVYDVFADGDRVAVRMEIVGTHTQPFNMPQGPLPPTGKSFTLPVINIFRFEDGKVAEQWSAFDMLGFLQQLGAMPH